MFQQFVRAEDFKGSELAHYEQPAGGGHTTDPDKKPMEGRASGMTAETAAKHHAETTHALFPSSFKAFGARTLKKAKEEVSEMNVCCVCCVCV